MFAPRSSPLGQILDGRADRIESFVLPETLRRRDHHLQRVPLPTIPPHEASERFQVQIPFEASLGLFNFFPYFKRQFCSLLSPIFILKICLMKS